MDNDQTVFESPSGQGFQNIQASNMPSSSASEPISQAQGAPLQDYSSNSQDFQALQQPLDAPPPPATVVDLSSGSRDDYSGANTFSIIKRVVKVLIGLIVVLLVFSLAFFVVIPNLSKNSSKNVTLTYWGLWEDSSSMQGIISDFERVNPNIKINYSKQDVKQYRERLLTRISNGSRSGYF